VAPRQNHGSEIPIPTSNEKARRVHGAHRDGASQLSKWRGKMKRPLALATQFMDLFYFPSSSIAQQGAAFQRAAGMHGMPLDAAASICLDAAPNCIFPSY
jgi:hypothetical protein